MNEMLKARDYKTDIKPVWCPGCGDYAILASLTKALAYLLLRECELHHLYAIYQGQRLGIDTELLNAAAGDGQTELH